VPAPGTAATGQVDAAGVSTVDGVPQVDVSSAEGAASEVPPAGPPAIAQAAPGTPAASATGRGGKSKFGKAATAPVDPNAPPAPPVGFQVTLVNFNGPFDLLLQLIGKQKLEITELALSRVTDEFIAYIRAMGDKWDLGEVSEFLVVAATLLDLKAAKLLPQAEVEDDEDLALLEARDLLFARLLQYKAFKEAASVIAALDAEFSRGYPRMVRLEPRYAEALPDLVLGIGVERLAQLAVKAMGPKPVPTVGIGHIHMVRVSVREHLAILREKLLRVRTATFRALCADCQSTLEVVARFLALLELYREGLVEFDQVLALGELTVTWVGDDKAGLEIAVDDYDGEVPSASASGGEPVEEIELLAPHDPDDEVDGEPADRPRPRRRKPTFKRDRPRAATDDEARDDDAENRDDGDEAAEDSDDELDDELVDGNEER
jgi:segregation and condensation protein A